MSKTVTKRAEEYGKQFIGPYTSDEAYAAGKDAETAYFQIAEEQLYKDRDFVFEWLRTHLPDYVEFLFNEKMVTMPKDALKQVLFEDWVMEEGI